MLQTYIQFLNPDQSEVEGEDFYENYVGTIKYVAADLGKVHERFFFPSDNCGVGLLGTIDGETYQGVKAEKEDCGFYKPDYAEMLIKNSSSKGVFFRMVFERQFTEFGLQTLQRGEPIQMRGGFNVFDSISKLSRVEYGYGDLFEVTFSVEVIEDGAFELTALSSVAALFLALMTF